MAHQTEAAAPTPRTFPLPALRAFGSLAARAGRGLRWYVTSLMGDHAYDTYVQHQQRVHPGVEPMTERAFWRERMDDQDRNPGARCC